MLEETGCEYETEILDYETTMKAPAYLAINPMGKVPGIPVRERFQVYVERVTSRDAWQRATEKDDALVSA